jgi:hypothetical protein
MMPNYPKANKTNRAVFRGIFIGGTTIYGEPGEGTGEWNSRVCGTIEFAVTPFIYN